MKKHEAHKTGLGPTDVFNNEAISSIIQCRLSNLFFFIIMLQTKYLFQRFPLWGVSPLLWLTFLFYNYQEKNKHTYWIIYRINCILGLFIEFVNAVPPYNRSGSRVNHDNNPEHSVMSWHLDLLKHFVSIKYGFFFMKPKRDIKSLLLLNWVYHMSNSIIELICSVLGQFYPVTHFFFLWNQVLV